MDYKVSEVGLGLNKKFILTDVKNKGAIRIFALYNDMLNNETNTIVLKDLLITYDLLMGDLSINKRVLVKYKYFYYLNPKKQVAKKQSDYYAEIHSTKNNKEELEYFINNNIQLGRSKVFERYIMDILEEFIEAKNWVRVQKLINLSIILGADYSYLYEKITI